MEKLKKGDKVKIREDLKPGNFYGDIFLLYGPMSDCLGQICTIACRIHGNYFTEENSFIWSREMLEKVAD